MLKKIYKAYHHAAQNHIWQGFRMGYIHQQVLPYCNTCTIIVPPKSGDSLNRKSGLFFFQIKKLDSLKAILRGW